MRNFELVGKDGTTIQFKDDQKVWLLQASNRSDIKTKGVSQSPEVSFVLGKHQWEIMNDTIECGEGGSYKTFLKLTGCNDGNFTCDDGQCVGMEQRCDQMPDCRD